jgi:hypothetical protein
MDNWTKLLLAATAVVVIGCAASIRGSCAFDPGCHMRSCPGHKYSCGVVHDPDDGTRAR